MSIYMIKHKNRNLYIGSTKNLKLRKYQHKNYCFYKNRKEYDKKLYQEIRKVTTKDNFVNDITFEILETDISNEDLLKKENEYIKKYDMIQNGFNINESYMELDIVEYKRQYHKKNFLKKKLYYQEYMKSSKYKKQQKKYYDNLPLKYKCIFCKYKCKRKNDLKKHKKSQHPKYFLFLFLFSSVVLS